MKLWTEWSTKLFVVSTITWLVLFFLEERLGVLSAPGWLASIPIFASAVALPGAIVGQVLKADKRARMAWAVLVAVAASLSAAILFLVE